MKLKTYFYNFLLIIQFPILCIFILFKSLYNGLIDIKEDFETQVKWSFCDLKRYLKHNLSLIDKDKK